jgi:hypothetical protein
MKDKKGETGKSAAQPPNTPPIVENLFSPEVYADGAFFFALRGGGENISITFGSSRFDNSSVPAILRNVIVGRLVMPTASAIAFVDDLNAYLVNHGQRPDKVGAH